MGYLNTIDLVCSYIYWKWIKPKSPIVLWAFDKVQGIWQPGFYNYTQMQWIYMISFIIDHLFGREIGKWLQKTWFLREFDSLTLTPNRCRYVFGFGLPTVYFCQEKAYKCKLKWVGSWNTGDLIKKIKNINVDSRNQSNTNRQKSTTRKDAFIIYFLFFTSLTLF
jgi:hypothetical protein